MILHPESELHYLLMPHGNENFSMDKLTFTLKMKSLLLTRCFSLKDEIILCY